VDVISLLRTPFVLVKQSHYKETLSKLLESRFNHQEALKEIGRARQEHADSDSRYKLATARLIQAHETVESLEELVAQTEEAKVLAVAQLESLKEEISYLRNEIKIYQARMGLLPQERQGQTDGRPTPLKSGRVPFAQAAAKISAQRTEEYWRQKAAAVDVEAGTTSTTTDTPAVSDKEL
jgi:chromosome segregation ATPase